MSGDPEFVVLKYSAWLDTEKYESKILGAIVRYFLRPTNDYVPEEPLAYNVTVNGKPRDFDEGKLTNYISDKTTTTSSNTLQSIAGFTWKGRTEDSAHLQGRLIRWKRLQQITQEYWPRLKKDKAVCKTVPSWISILNAWPPCLVVGIMIAEDVELDFSGSQTRDFDEEMEVPIKTQHSQIFALELRKITTPFIRRTLELNKSGPKVDPGRLAEHGKETEEDHVLPTVDELEIEGFTNEEYDEM